MAFPDLLTLRLSFTARRALELPCLPTVALHSVFGSALHDASCDKGTAADCSSCGASPTCLYARLFEPAGTGASGEGVTNHAPPPVVLAPEEFVLSDSPIHLAHRSRIRFRVTLVGPLAIASRDTVVQAIRTGAARGVGRPPAGKEREYVPLELDDMHVIPPLALPVPRSVRIDLVSPLRLKADGKIRAGFDAVTFARALARRARMLSLAHAPDAAPGEPAVGALRMGSQRLGTVRVSRYSARQDRRMNLPGVVGFFEIEGNLAPVWDWLLFGERAQAGKGAALGFGRYALTPLA